MSGFIPAASVRVVGACHLIRLRVDGDPYPEVAVAPEGLTLAQVRELHAQRRLRFVREPKRLARIVVVEPEAAGAF